MHKGGAKKGCAKPAGSGRKAGTPNKTTLKAREAITALTDKLAPDLEQWMREIYEIHGPKDAISAYLDMAEYAIPKLARTEVTGQDGGAIQSETRILIQPVKPLEQKDDGFLSPTRDDTDEP